MVVVICQLLFLANGKISPCFEWFFVTLKDPYYLRGKVDRAGEDFPPDLRFSSFQGKEILEKKEKLIISAKRVRLALPGIIHARSIWLDQRSIGNEKNDRAAHFLLLQIEGRTLQISRNISLIDGKISLENSLRIETHLLIAKNRFIVFEWQAFHLYYF